MAVVIEDIDDSVIVFTYLLSLSCSLEYFSNHTWSQSSIPRCIFIEDFLQDFNDFILECTILVEEDVLIEPLTLCGLIDIQCDISVGSQVAYFLS